MVESIDAWGLENRANTREMRVHSIMVWYQAQKTNLAGRKKKGCRNPFEKTECFQSLEIVSVV